MHRHNSEIQNALVSKRSMLLSWKIVNRYKTGTLLRDENKNFDSSLILDFRISWRHVQAKNYGREYSMKGFPKGEQFIVSTSVRFFKTEKFLSLLAFGKIL